MMKKTVDDIIRVLDDSVYILATRVTRRVNKFHVYTVSYDLTVVGSGNRNSGKQKRYVKSPSALIPICNTQMSDRDRVERYNVQLTKDYPKYTVAVVRNRMCKKCHEMILENPGYYKFEYKYTKSEIILEYSGILVNYYKVKNERQTK
jgi:hypothetical protein